MIHTAAQTDGPLVVAIPLVVTPLALVLTSLALAVALAARARELRGGPLLDKIRVGEAVTSDDFWLSLRGWTA